MKQRIKKTLKQMIAMVLIVSQSIVIPAYGTEKEYIGTDKKNPEKTYVQNQAAVNNPAYTYYSWIEDQGLRLYVTDENGNLISSDTGYDVIDFLYLTALKPGNYNAKHLRSTASDAGIYSTDVKSISELGFQTDIAYAPNSVKEAEGMFDTMLQQYANSNVKNHIYTDEEIYINDKEYKYYIDDPDLGEISRGLYVIKKYWNSLYQTCKMEAEINGNSSEYYLHIEHIYAIIRERWNNPTDVTWYGTVYEAGRQYQESGNLNFLGAFNTWFTKRGAKFLSMSNQMYECFQNFPALQLATNDNNDVHLSANDLCTQAYGINIMSFAELGISDTETKPSDALVDEVPVEKEAEKIITKVEAVDGVEIYTGYGAQNGFYDIGTNGGIPTTEEIRNVIEAQDFIIDYGYNAEKFSPEIGKEPKVTYTLEHYVDCHCSREVSDYGYDEDGDWGKS